MKYLTDQLQLVFVFALATPDSYILFLYCNFTTFYAVLQRESSITIYIEERVWDAVRKNIISDRFNTKTAISSRI